MPFFLLSPSPKPPPNPTVLYTFTGGPDGGSPLYVKLIGDPAGNLYGTTNGGGSSGKGTIFKLDATGKETVLYNFSGGADGWGPGAGLVRDKQGNLYGTTQIGGQPCFDGPNGCGVVFELDAKGNYQVIHTFTGVSDDGGFPQSRLALAPNGALFGTTAGGGISTPDCQNGAGAVFELVPGNGTWTESILYEFPCTATDGMFPYSSVTLSSGSLYGTTAGGGTCPGGSLDACGTVYRLKRENGGVSHIVLHAFSGNSDGAELRDGLIRDSSGNLYGTTQLGGANGFGTIFRIDPTGVKTELHSFAGNDGAYPVGGLTRDSAGNFYGMTQEGGTSLVGTVFKLDSSNNLTVLHNFTGNKDGAYPYGDLLLSGGWLYGVTLAGGNSNQGTVFQLQP